MVVCTVRTGYSVARIPQAVVPVQCPVACAGLPCRSQQKNILLQHHPWRSCRDIKSSVTTEISHPWENSVATRRLCRLRMLRCRAGIPVVHACLSCTPRSGHAPGLRTMSRHEKPRHDTGSTFSVATRNPLS